MMFPDVFHSFFSKILEGRNLNTLFVIQEKLHHRKTCSQFMQSAAVVAVVSFIMQPRIYMHPVCQVS